MLKRVNLLLNIKPGEAGVVGYLFLVQYFLGIATAFLFTSSLTLILSTYEVTVFPKIYILAAVFLLLTNLLYARLETRFSSSKLLQVVVVFSAVSVLMYWLCLSFFPSHWLPLLLAVWNMVVYMLVGYAFWGMAAIMFNVRESKRLFSIVGAGDIPAKMLGYFSVTALVPLIGVVNLLWVSITAFVVVVVLLKRFKQTGNASLLHAAVHHTATHHKNEVESIVSRYFHNRLIFYIAFWSLLAYIIYSIIDFTFLAEIKAKYTSDHELATFIAVFFALGRLLAIGIKLVFSSRVIAKLGLANCLLIAPIVLFLINGYILISGGGITAHLYVFGEMVLLSEILRSTLQEPVFFVLFQPLNPHSRLKGHLIAKGYTLPFALLAVGVFFLFYLQYHESISIAFISGLLFFLLLGWGASVFLIRKAYLQTLVSVIKRGYFTGTELFLNDKAVTQVLLNKAVSNNSKEAIHALNLLERSGYRNMFKLFLRQLQNGSNEVKEYVMSRVIENNMVSALPLIRRRLKLETDKEVKALYIKAIYYLDRHNLDYQAASIQDLDKESKKAALIGLLCRNEPDTEQVVALELLKMANSSSVEDKLIAVNIVQETRRSDYSHILEMMLLDANPAIYKKAIEAIGEVKCFNLLELMVRVALDRKAHFPLQKALLHYGDNLYTTEYVQHVAYPAQLECMLVKAAGKIKGENATAFLEQLLQENRADRAGVVDALWQKKATVSGDTQRLLRKWVKLKLKQSTLKATYFLQLAPHHAVKPLQDALGSEIHQDVQILFKAMSLLYDRQQIERVMELYNLGDPAKVYNAIEMLELVVPRKYFTPLNMLVELEQDRNTNQLPLHHGKVICVNDMIEDILQEREASFSTWTKSVACYMIPRLQPDGPPAFILNVKASNDDYLFQETRHYVVSMLN
jgi:hypothetical protein